ncbi:putative receptor-like serine/threonine-protein kinase [Dorcoceras hygrometricum]|uniref:Putative receptor-like serine/threonine-protein kinase n=2 Tax=Dorcoceras hygrometricum TaxID=472368 RepID=A0A2Z7CV61_9LAMI|nr:putative receptor-like serine/threonine-protein kinase [Dorcoceras hygrometricum]
MRLNLGRKNVVVGIRFDEHTRELLDWAVVKVAESGDNVVAVHVCRNSDCISKQKEVLDGYLEDHRGLFDKRQVSLCSEVVKGNSIRKVLVREAKKYDATAVILGITKHNALGGWNSIAKYCAKRLPQSTEVMAIHNGKVVYSRCSLSHLEGLGDDPKPSIYLKKSHHTFKDYLSEFDESEISEMSRLSCDGREDDISISLSRVRRSSLSSIFWPAEDFTKQRPGWPLLQTASSVTQPALEAREMSVVQWVMNLPHRSLGKSAHQQELPKDVEHILKENSACCQVFSHNFIKKSTSGFSAGHLIGKGGSNRVYKGVLPEGRSVAIKVLQYSEEAWKDFIREFDIMTTVKHERITPLLGICVESRSNLVSVYDLLSKGNLEENLHGSDGTKDTLISWAVRFKIAFGIAEALNYLHNECQRPVIHRDIKSSNILLTDELEPQLSDFGLAIWGPTKTSFLTDSDVVGTFGYLAPEYFMYGKVSDKIDVYAFGVVLLELLSGRKPIGIEMTKDQESLVMWAKPKLENGDFKSILDPNLDGAIDEIQMKRMALAATLCLTQAARLRPKMCQILKIPQKAKKNAPGSDHSSEGDDPSTVDSQTTLYPFHDRNPNFFAGHLSGTCAWLQPVFQEPGASRLIAVDSSIQSTTRLEAPSSDCTRSPDEISTIGSSTSNWPEQNSGDDRRRAAAASCRVSMTFRVVRTNQYNQDLGLIHSTNGNHLESPKEGSSIDHQVTIYLHAQNITMFPTNETWYFASQILVSNSGGLILVLTAQSTRNMFRIHSDY